MLPVALMLPEIFFIEPEPTVPDPLYVVPDWVSVSVVESVFEELEYPLAQVVTLEDNDPEKEPDTSKAAWAF